jgi:hypothetical protein
MVHGINPGFSLWYTYTLHNAGDNCSSDLPLLQLPGTPLEEASGLSNLSNGRDNPIANTPTHPHPYQIEATPFMIKK